MKLFKNYPKEPSSVLVSNSILSLDNPLKFRNNLLLLVKKSKQSKTKLSKRNLNTT